MTSRQRGRTVEDAVVDHADPEDAEEDSQGKRAGSAGFSLTTFTTELLVQTCFSMFFLVLIIVGLGYDRDHRRSVVAPVVQPGVADALFAFDSHVAIIAEEKEEKEVAAKAPFGAFAQAGAAPEVVPLSVEERAAASLLLFRSTAPPEPSLEDLEKAVAVRRGPVMALRRSGRVDMTSDPGALDLERALQNASLALLRRRYGDGPVYTLDVDLEFPENMGGGAETIVVETAPNWMMPHSVHVFLDSAVTKFKLAAFHRNAGHVLQALIRTEKGANGLAFQEYDARYPHRPFTMGFAGRPGGPEFYISMVDNTENHGPGSQGSKTEADSCFATVTPESHPILERMRHLPAPKSGSGFISDPKGFIRIPKITLRQQEKQQQQQQQQQQQPPPLPPPAAAA